jgi:ribosomal protein L7/L12
MKLLLLVVGIIVMVFLIDRANRIKVRRLRESGVYPPVGQGTIADVEWLIVLKKKIPAIKLYREIHGVDLKTAKEAVERLEQGLRQSGSLRL